MVNFIAGHIKCFVRILTAMLLYQLAIEGKDVYKAIDKIRQHSGKIIRDAGPMNAGTTIIAFVQDPDGYEIELIGKK